MTINFTCRMQTKYDNSWQYCNILGVPFEKDEYGNNIRFTGFRQNISKLHQLDEEVKERNYKMELTFKTIGMSYWDFDIMTRQFKAFNDPVNDYHPERAITPNDYMEVAHPEDLDCIGKYIEHMLQRTDKEFSFQYRSKSKWDVEWQTLIVTGIPVERDKKGNVTRYTGIKFNNTKWEKMAQELKELKEKAELFRPAQISIPCQHEP
ncbi:PAS domain-containing protein [Bacteroides sp. CR5/BHMF/2]|nr:PAS domain-containing protein [Bacteroides sp. CR5/BHMF/2]